MRSAPISHRTFPWPLHRPIRPSPPAPCSGRWTCRAKRRKRSRAQKGRAERASVLIVVFAAALARRHESNRLQFGSAAFEPGSEDRADAHQPRRRARTLDRARDLMRRAILARGFLLDTERWPVGKKGRRFDVDAQLIDPGAREEWRQGWRGALDSLGLVAAADEAPLAALEVALADHSYGQASSERGQ